ncbi:hypothetical protein ACH4FX_34740 [Streptomyces sp. NPDC018019]|uniref:hypothetical protein n=1 Tax=Streptomyces sp. NPDC018019 TaxID=3365030 RepID=UPI0037BC1685
MAGATAAVVLVTLAVTVTAGGGTPVAATVTGPALTLTGMRDTYEIPRAGSPVRDDAPGEYRIGLTAREPHPVVTDVQVSIDLTALKDEVHLVRVDKGHRCGMTGRVMTCTVDVDRSAAFTPFALAPRPGAVPGPAGAMTVTVTGPGTPTVRHTTQVVVGAPAVAGR